MADNFQVERVDANEGENLDVFGRDHNEKLQAMARSLVSALYMLVRSVKMYDSDNNVFDKPLNQMLDTINQIIRKDGQAGVDGREAVVLPERHAGEGRHGRARQREVSPRGNALQGRGGFTLLRTATLPELKNFVSIFSKEQTEAAGEEGVAGKKLVSMKLAKWSRAQEQARQREGRERGPARSQEVRADLLRPRDLLHQQVHGVAAHRQAAQHLEGAAHHPGLRRHLHRPPHALPRAHHHPSRLGVPRRTTTSTPA